MFEPNEEAQLRGIEEFLILKFDGKVARDAIHTELLQTEAMFHDAKIRTYIPVLIQREAVNRLRSIDLRAARQEPVTSVAW